MHRCTVSGFRQPDEGKCQLGHSQSQTRSFYVSLSAEAHLECGPIQLAPTRYRDYLNFSCSEHVRQNPGLGAVTVCSGLTLFS